MVSREGSLWCAFHVGFDTHPKVEPLTDAAFRELVALILYSRRHGFHGTIPAHRWAKVREAVRKQLTAIQQGQSSPLIYPQPDKSAVIHDYEDWQPTAAEVAAAQESSSKGGSLGNHRRWHTKRNVIDPKCRYCRPNQSTDQGGDQSPDQTGESLRASGGDR